MDRLKVSQKIWLGVLAIGIFLVVVLAGAAYRAVGINASVRESMAQQAARQDLIARWAALSEVNAARAEAAIAANDNTVGDYFKAAAAATSEQISQLQQQIEALAKSDAEKASLAQVAAARKPYIEARKAALELKAAGKPDEAHQALAASVKPALDAYLAAQRGFRDAQRALDRDEIVEFDARRARSTAMAGYQLLGLMVALVVGAHFMIRSIRRPLLSAQQTASRIGGGDLTEEIDTTRPDEVGDVLRALAVMQASLTRTLGQVRSGTESIDTASREVAAGGQDLSARTEQAAGNLQQAASSMEQLTTTVRQSVAAAEQARTLASSASAVATRGGEVVLQVVETMDGINASSRRIADIIGVIDGIAFQTNILALNAAVEAARAGEQGRGFAVVAGEVRLLAQRSAEAAREIKSLIGASVERVDSGTQLVSQAGATMNEIVASVKRVSAMIEDITRASESQASGLGEVNHAVSELDRMTQQNAALVEQSAAAAESLRDQAARLAEIVSTFHVRAA